MRYLGNCLFALLTPWGRLTAAPFAAMAILLMAAHGYIQIHLAAIGDELPTYNSWSMGYFIIMWLTFCIVSRRFHDAGKAALFLVPLLMATFASYLYAFDNLHFADSDFAEDRAMLSRAEHIRLVLQFLVLGTLAYATLQPGDYGDNAFGPEFFRKKAAPSPKTTQRASALTENRRISRTLKPAQAAPVTEPAKHMDFDASGPRGRITPAESARNRRDGFGRR